MRRTESGRGRLKVFLGAAPGVGKTYEMLQNAHARMREGVDVVVGVVETHGRPDTAALLEGLTLLPRRRDALGRDGLDEMDLDAILARRPALVLVDELAHTNAPGSRHPKRYLDVLELIEAGIDVDTTLNIQHVESLNDVVAQITRIRVRETVPDSILDAADAIELIDLTPDDLIRRLNDGKVYGEVQARRALAHYFSAGNLTALRELALRRTAERVDAQLLTHMRAHAISGPWAAGERVLVCVGADRNAPSLVRYAKRLADRLHAPWTALVVEGRRTEGLSAEDQGRMSETLRLAERLGGESAVIPGGARRMADDVAAYATERNVTHIVIGKTGRSRLSELFAGSLMQDLVRQTGNISLHVIAGEAAEEVGEAGASKAVRAAVAHAPFRARPYAVAVLAAGIALGVGVLVRPIAGVENVDLVFLTAVVAIAAAYGRAPSLLCMALASLAYNFFFLPPLYTFTIADPTNIAAIILFTLVALIVSGMAARVRAQAVSAQSRARTTDALYAFSRKLAGVGSLDDVLWVTAFQIASMLPLRVVLLLPEDDRLAVAAGYPPEDEIDEADLAAAKWTFAQGRAAGRGADTLPGARRLFLPMRTGRGVIGVIGVDGPGSGPLLTPAQGRLLDALADQGALAIERVRLVADVERARRTAETDRLRQALLTSISHDLRTPLSAILGAGTTLRDLDAHLDGPAKTGLVGTIIEESERLNRFIANLLDMTRLEAGAVAPNASLQDLNEIVGTALRRAGPILAEHRVEVGLSPDLPAVRIDPVLTEQVLFNLLDNAVKYSGPGTAIRVQGFSDAQVVGLQILDEGPGFSAADRERVFDKFYRAAKGDAVRAGTGLGLAIARGFVEAMGGAITAGNRSDHRGAVLTVTFPRPQRTSDR